MNMVDLDALTTPELYGELCNIIERNYQQKPPRLYYQDDAVGDVGPMAELLFVRSLAYCAGKSSDGFMTERQVRLYVSVGLDDAEELCKRLVAARLWDRDDDREGYMVRKLNRSTSTEARTAANAIVDAIYRVAGIERRRVDPLEQAKGSHPGHTDAWYAAYLARMAHYASGADMGTAPELPAE